MLNVDQKPENEGRNAIEVIGKHVDFSNYPASHPLYNSKTRNQLFFVKDEAKGVSITHFVGLRSKSYVYQTASKHIERRAKGISRAFKDTVSFEAYKDCIFHTKESHIRQYQIRSVDHTLKTVAVNKMNLSPFDCKRYLYNCSIHTIPFGHVSKNPICPLCNNLSVV